MTVIGFTFSKINIERKAAIPQKIEVRSKINIHDISPQDVKLVQGKDTLRFEFSYNIEYSPDLAHVNFGGHLLMVFDSKEAESILSAWKKDKTISKNVKASAYNTIFHKCNVKAFELEEDFNLPLHLKLPTIKAD